MRCQLRQCFGYRAVVVRRVQQGKIKLFLRGGQKVERIIRDDPALRKHTRRFAVGQHDLDRLAGSIQENTALGPAG